MNFLNFSKANCKNCYKCLRYCPVKAIQIKNEQATIIEERCIGCGQCMRICPQDARKVKSDIKNVKRVLNANRKVVVSIAPSFSAAFNVDNPLKIIRGLELLGFNNIEETAIGAQVVTELYRDFIKENNLKNIITTSCPSSCYLIEKYFPNLIDYTIPVVSPMLAHGKLIKKKYGMDSFVVFIGPCTAKKIESDNFQHKGVIDAVLNFEEILEWFEEEKIYLNNLTPKEFDNTSDINSLKYPLKGGVIGNLLQDEFKEKYSLITVDGIEECMQVFESLQNNTLENVVVEAHVCTGSCIGGAAMPKEQNDFYKKKLRVSKYISDKNSSIEENTEINIKNDYEIKDFIKNMYDRSYFKEKVSEEKITKVLNEMGKYTKLDELNCGACGYDSCRKKAIAIIEGMAEKNMCLPYMRSKAESLKNIIFENSPNAIILMDSELNIIEFNPSAENFFGVESNEIKFKPISKLLDDEIFYRVKMDKKNIYRQKVYYDKYNKVVLQNILYLEKQNVVLSIMVDATNEESNKKELNRVKEQTIDAAQSVIEKQMRVAQEIASLLGETTAETKVILTKLKNISNGEMGEL